MKPIYVLKLQILAVFLFLRYIMPVLGNQHNVLTDGIRSKTTLYFYCQKAKDNRHMLKAFIYYFKIIMNTSNFIWQLLTEQNN